tara:strand:+ start:579 stop:797 length:219 start_codon:yes stop_codon:yes gene_type:complete
MGNSFAMNTVSILDTTNKNEKIAKKYKKKCNNVYSSVNKDEDSIKPKEDKVSSKIETSSIKKKPLLTIDTNV